jgi:hypothetical protein
LLTLARRRGPPASASWLKLGGEPPTAANLAGVPPRCWAFHIGGLDANAPSVRDRAALRLGANQRWCSRAPPSSLNYGRGRCSNHVAACSRRCVPRLCVVCANSLPAGRPAWLVAPARPDCRRAETPGDRTSLELTDVQGLLDLPRRAALRGPLGRTRFECPPLRDRADIRRTRKRAYTSRVARIGDPARARPRSARAVTVLRPRVTSAPPPTDGTGWGATVSAMGASERIALRTAARTLREIGAAVSRGAERCWWTGAIEARPVPISEHTARLWGLHSTARGTRRSRRNGVVLHPEGPVSKSSRRPRWHTRWPIWACAVRASCEQVCATASPGALHVVAPAAARRALRASRNWAFTRRWRSDEPQRKRSSPHERSKRRGSH